MRKLHGLHWNQMRGGFAGGLLQDDSEGLSPLFEPGFRSRSGGELSGEAPPIPYPVVGLGMEQNFEDRGNPEGDVHTTPSVILFG